LRLRMKAELADLIVDVLHQKSLLKSVEENVMVALKRSNPDAFTRQEELSGSTTISICDGRVLLEREAKLKCTPCVMNECYHMIESEENAFTIHGKMTHEFSLDADKKPKVTVSADFENKINVNR
jgi:hypothetical protein